MLVLLAWRDACIFHFRYHAFGACIMLLPYSGQLRQKHAQRVSNIFCFLPAFFSVQITFVCEWYAYLFKLLFITRLGNEITFPRIIWALIVHHLFFCFIFFRCCRQFFLGSFFLLITKTCESSKMWMQFISLEIQNRTNESLCEHDMSRTCTPSKMQNIVNNNISFGLGSLKFTATLVFISI